MIGLESRSYRMMPSHLTERHSEQQDMTYMQLIMQSYKEEENPLLEQELPSLYHQDNMVRSDQGVDYSRTQD